MLHVIKHIVYNMQTLKILYHILQFCLVVYICY